MAFINQPYHFQMHGAFPSLTRDEVRYTEGHYVPVMNGVAPAFDHGHDENLLTPQMRREGRPYSSRFSNYQQGASYHVPGPSGRYQGSAQQESRTGQPEARGHGGRNLSSHGDARYHPYNGYQHNVPPNPFASFGNTYPSGQHTYQDTRPSAFRNYGVAYPTTPFVLKKLYGNKIQNNSVRAFGRDLTTKEIKEIKKGDNAVFPIQGDATPAARRTVKKNRSKGAAKPTKPKANAKAQSTKRKHVTEDDEQSSEKDVRTQVRSNKRARHGRKQDSIAAEVEDLVMFEESPTLLDHAGATGRYSLRATQKDAKARTRIAAIEESSNESTVDEEYEDVPTQRYSTRETSRSSKGVDESSCESSIVTHDEEKLAPRVPIRRIPGAGDVGGKSKGPSWVSSTGKNDQNNGEKDHRHTAVPVSIGGRVHYATYEGLISNGPAYNIGGSHILTQGQAPKVNSASFAQKESHRPEPHAFNVMMKMPLFEEKNLEEEDTPLQTHRKRVRELLGDDEAEAYAPSSKRLRTEQQGLPVPGAAAHGANGSIPPQVVPQPIAPPPTIPPQTNQSSSAPLAPPTQSPQTRNQKLGAEWARVFEQTFKDLGFKSVNYSEVPPWNDEEVQSLIDALLPTREVYFAWTKEPAPRTDPYQSYRAQFDTIFNAFQDWWRRHRSNEPLPILAGVMHFGRSVDDFEAPSKDSIYYEAFRKGYRKLPDSWPGSKLEEAFRKGW